MRRISSLAAVGSIVLASTLLVASPRAVEAHETRAIGDGQYQIVVGFMNEPVFAGDKSGLEFWVTEVSTATPAAGQQEGDGTPVEDLDETLQAEVLFEDQTLALPLSPLFGEPGGYRSVFFPTAPGDYTFRIYGTIDGTEIDESFTSGPETFSPVADPAPRQFPQP
jgi:hypothetical protein